MRTDLNAPVLRRFTRAVALAPVVLVSFATPAIASPPETWPEPQPVSTLEVLLLLVGVPLGLFLVITLLTYLPSMARGEKYTPGLAWRNESEWFGGPTRGLDAADETDSEAAKDTERGGASARW